jgi:signal transduction histidine kinase
VASARVVGLAFLAGALLMAMPVAAGAVSVLPTPDIPLPLPTLSPSLPPLGSNPLPSPGALPSLAVGPTRASPATPQGQGGGGVGRTGGTVASATASSDSVISTVFRLLASQVPVFPVLLPLLAGLIVLLVSAVLAAYRRTQEARRFERLERTKSDFLQLASHELRTPLTVLLGYVSMIRDGDVKPDTQAFARVLSILEDRLNQVNTIVEQMLEAARLEEGNTLLNLVVFDLVELAAESVAGIKARTRTDHPIGFRPATAKLRLRSDRPLVAAILDQLLDNAVKYSPEGGEIECSLAEMGGRAQFTVQDHGLGIAPEDQGRIFTRFGRLVTRENSHIMGAGLGLFLAREHARRMGGDITVESRPAEGSAFTLSLPLVASPEPERAPVHPPRERR